MASLVPIRVPVPAVEQRIASALLEEDDRAREAVLLDVLAQLPQLGLRHQREQVGGGVDLDDVAPGRGGLDGLLDVSYSLCHVRFLSAWPLRGIITGGSGVRRSPSSFGGVDA